MTNFQSFAGSFVWVAVAGALMLAAFQPVEVAAPAKHVQLSAKASASADRAAA